jgi:hypothetical protein
MVIALVMLELFGKPFEHFPPPFLAFFPLMTVWVTVGPNILARSLGYRRT